MLPLLGVHGGLVAVETMLPLALILPRLSKVGNPRREAKDRTVEVHVEVGATVGDGEGQGVEGVMTPADGGGRGGAERRGVRA